MEARVETVSPAVGCGDGMTAELRGVPRAALQTVFGKALGRRIWERGRRFGESKVDATAVADRCSPAEGTGDTVADPEIVGGMIEYVSKRAGEALRQNGRQAKAIGLRLVHRDGVSTLERTRLARPTNDGLELAAAAMELLNRSQGRGVVVVSVDLKVASILTEPIRARVDGLGCAMVRVASA